jgi:hypothetical protein
MRVVVTEKAVREYISELMSGPGWGAERTASPSPVVTSAVVDPSAAVTDPSNVNFKPRNRAELKTAMSSVINKISDDSAADLYVAIQDVIEDKEKKEKEMNKTESIIRAAVRKLLKEVEYDPNDPKLPPVKKIPYGVHGSEYMRNLEKRKTDLRKTLEKSTLDDEEGSAKSDEPVAGRTRKNVMQTDVGGASFADIAKELGFATTSGAKAAVEKAMQKAKFLAGMDPDDLEILTLTAMNDYIDVLKSTGELTGDDVKLMKDHPEIVSSLDGFREFLDKSLKKAQK